MERKPNLGKRLAIGDTFRTTTKTMTKDRHGSTRWNKDMNGPLITYEVLKPGTRRHFVKGKRQYYCEVLVMVEMRTGVWASKCGPSIWKGRRWWQFTYLVEVLEN